MTICCNGTFACVRKSSSAIVKLLCAIMEISALWNFQLPLYGQVKLLNFIYRHLFF